MELYGFAQKRVQYLQRQLHDNSLALEASEMLRSDLEDAYIENTKTMCQAIESLFRLNGVWTDDA